MVDVPPVSLPASLNTSASTARPLVVQIRNTCPATPPHCLHRLPVGDVDVLRCYVPCFIPSVDSSVDSSVDVVAGNSVGAANLVPVSGLLHQEALRLFLLLHQPHLWFHLHLGPVPPRSVFPIFQALLRWLIPIGSQNFKVSLIL